MREIKDPPKLGVIGKRRIRAAVRKVLSDRRNSKREKMARERGLVQ